MPTDKFVLPAQDKQKFDRLGKIMRDWERRNGYCQGSIKGNKCQCDMTEVERQVAEEWKGLINCRTELVLPFCDGEVHGLIAGCRNKKQKEE